MRSIFLAASYQKKEEIKDLYLELKRRGFAVSAPIFDYQPNKVINYESLMTHSFNEIRRCDIFLADVTYKEIGIGIEAGFAKGLSKPIIYIRNEDSDLSTTMSGISNIELVYKAGNYSEVVEKCSNLRI